MFRPMRNHHGPNASRENATPSATVPIRLVITDDHVLVLKALELLFARESDFVVVAACANADQTLEAVRRHRPDVLVLDIRLPGLDGLAVLRAMNQDGASLRVVLLTAEIDDDQMLEAVRLGAAGIVLKEMAPHLLMECIRTVHAGEKWVEQKAMGRALDTLLRREKDLREITRMLTNRELDIVRMIVLGLHNAQIAVKLCVSEATVKSHLHHIYEKLGVDGRMGLLLLAQQKGVK